MPSVAYWLMTPPLLARYNGEAWRHPVVDPSAAPEVLAVSCSRQRMAKEAEEAQRAASLLPRRVLDELRDAQRCSKPQLPFQGAPAASVCQSYVPYARVRLTLEPDGGAEDATVGTAVFRLWIWTSRWQSSGAGKTGNPVQPRHQRFFHVRAAASAPLSLLKDTATVRALIHPSRVCGGISLAGFLLASPREPRHAR